MATEAEPVEVSADDFFNPPQLPNSSFPDEVYILRLILSYVHVLRKTC